MPPAAALTSELVYEVGEAIWRLHVAFLAATDLHLKSVLFFQGDGYIQGYRDDIRRKIELGSSPEMNISNIQHEIIINFPVAITIFEEQYKPAKTHAAGIDPALSYKRCFFTDERFVTLPMLN